MRERDGAERRKGREGGKRGREGGGIRKTDRQTDRQRKGGEMQWDAPILFHLELALERIRLTALKLLCAGLPHQLGCLKCPFLKWSQMVDLSQPVFDNQMLSSHKGVLQPGCMQGAELSSTEHHPFSVPDTPGQALPQPQPPGGACRNWCGQGLGNRQIWV